jgi:hypothetical protein
VQRRGKWIDLVDPNAVAAGMFCRVQRRVGAAKQRFDGWLPQLRKRADADADGHVLIQIGRTR